ncbi:MAG: CCA tRNA nucleotidyltransferase [Proteobacteria bacterium]|nr:CCA tRNA nucleotidyltransferase [Pseudomonadota bacterium]
MTATSRRIDLAAWPFAGPLARLMDVLDGKGEEARVVGGAVRNALIDAPIHEVDVATTAVPEEVIRRAKAAGFKPVPTGIEHGTVTVVIDKHPFEVTTLRTDVETFGRHAKVAFGRDWREDALRRDFTMNALSVTRDGTVHDYAGGLDDLAKRHVRFIGDAAQRIAEDYLRILRFFRFHAAYGGGGPPDAAGLAACIAAREGLSQLSRERLRMEMLKLVAAKHATPTLIVMSDAGFTLSILAGVIYLSAFENMTKVEAAAGLAADATRRLGALGAAVAEDAERLYQRLRLANHERDRIRSMADGWHGLSPAMSEREMRALIYRRGVDAFTDQALLAWARSQAMAHDAAWHEFIARAQRFTPPVFPLKADDLIKRGIAKGPALGAALRAAEDAWIAADFPTDAAALRAIADEAAARRS